MSRVLLLVLLVVVLIAPGASGKVVYVDQGATGAVHDGASWPTAHLTVTTGLSAADSGDEVWVAKGVYTERIKPPGGIALYGGFTGTETWRHQRDWKANPTVLDGGQPGVGSVVVCRHEDIVVDGFTLRNAYYDGIAVGGGTTVIGNCAISGNAIGVSAYRGAVILINNTISGNSRGVESDSEGMSWCDLTLVNNTISDNGSGVYVQGGTATLINNTVCVNGSGVHVRYGNTIANNIVAFNRGYGVRAGSIQTFAHNDVHGNTGGDYSGYTPPMDQGNLSIDPKLASIYLDPHIQPDSPCVDAGDDTKVDEKKDIDGQRRIQGEHVDIGSDESDGTTWVFPSVIWHVSESGSDANDGLTWATAKRTVTSALEAVRGEDEVWVARGVYTYTERLVLPAYVSLYGGFTGTETRREHRDWKANITVLNGTGFYPYIVCGKPDITVDGFTLLCGGVACGGTTVIANNMITRCDWGVSAGGTALINNNTITGNGIGVNAASGTPTISNNIISGNWFDGGVFMYDDEDVGATATFINNTISGNSAGVTVDTGTAILINNTITGNNSYGVSGESSTSRMTNNIVAFNGGYGVSATSINVFTHNNVYGNVGGDYMGPIPPGGQGNLSVDPRLSNIYRNVHLQPDSPCINAGDDAAVLGATDIDGQPRVQAERVDIGSDESDGTVWDVPSVTLHVSTAGSDDNDGKAWQTAKRTINAALAAVRGLDEVWVARGVYPEWIAPPAGVALYGGFAGTETERGQRDWTANATVLEGSGYNLVLGYFRNIKLDGFTLLRGGIAVTGNRAIITNNILSGSNDSGATLSGEEMTFTNNTVIQNLYGLYINGGTPVVRNNTISGNSHDGVNINYGRPVILNNTITGNGEHGVHVFNSAAVTLSNNTISGNSAYGVYVFRGTATLRNNIVAFNKSFGVATGAEGITTANHNDVYGNSYGNYSGYMTPGGDGSISRDPMFQDLTNGNFRLQPGSPCIDAGDNTAVPPGSTDKDGKPRIIGSHVDIGAYEFDRGAPIPITLDDVRRALGIAGGLQPPSAEDLSRLNTEPGDSALTVVDAIRLVRKAAGLEANP